MGRWTEEFGAHGVAQVFTSWKLWNTHGGRIGTLNISFATGLATSAMVRRNEKQRVATYHITCLRMAYDDRDIF